MRALKAHNNDGGVMVFNEDGRDRRRGDERTCGKRVSRGSRLQEQQLMMIDGKDACTLHEE